MDGEAVDAGIDLAVPQDRVIGEIEAIDHAHACPIVIADIELSGYGTRRDTFDVMNLWNRLNGLQKAMPAVDVIHRNRTAADGRLVDRI